MSAILSELNIDKRLALFIKRCWLYKGNFENPQFLKILPYGAVEIIAHKNSSMDYYIGQEVQKEPSIFIEGQYLEPSFKRPSSNCQFLGITLQPWASKTLFGLPSSELTGNLIDLNLIHKDFKDQLEEIVGNNYFNNSIERPVNRFLHSVFKGSKLDSDVADLAEISRSDKFSYTTDWNQTNRSFQVKFKELFGITWRQLRNKQRFTKAIQYLNQANISQTDVAHLAGYYDQAHFIRHFNQFSGMTPTRYLKSRDVMVELTKLCSN